MYDFSNLCFKLDKAHADILKSYIRADFQNDLFIYDMFIIIDIAR